MAVIVEPLISASILLLARKVEKKKMFLDR
jgi:hypothetical protein